MPNINFEDAFDDLKVLLALIHVVLDDATDNANSFQQEHDELVKDRCLWSSIVRAYCAKRLPGEFADEPFFLEKGFNISLTIHGRKYSVRVRKAKPGELPSPGNSPGSLAFFNQSTQQPLFFMKAEGDSLDAGEPRQNLILVWGVDDSGRLVELILAYPKPTPEGEDQQWYWAKSVFAETMPGQISFGTGDLLQDLDDVKRLDEEEERADDEEEGEGETGTDIK